MTTCDWKKVKCANCGKEQEVCVLMSTNTFGPCDFDLRPAPMKRDTLPMCIEFCETCEYGSHDIGKISETGKSVLEKKEYHNFIHSFSDDEIVMAYLGDYYIKKEEGKYKEAFYAMKSVSWLLDDKRSEKAKDARILALECFDKCSEKGFPIDEHIAKTDMLRRAGKFDEAIALAEKLLEKVGQNELLSNIIKYEIKFAKNKDTRCHSIGEIQ